MGGDQEKEVERMSKSSQADFLSLKAELGDLASEAIAVVDPATGFLFTWNSAFQRTFRVSRREFFDIRSIFVQDWAKETWDRILEAGPGRTWRPARILLRSSGGVVFPGEVKIRWIERSGLALLGMAVKDLSMEEKISLAMGRTVRMRTLAFLSSSLVHRMNNYLGTITGFASSLKDAISTPTANEALSRIEEAGLHAASLTNSVMKIMDPPEGKRWEFMEAGEEWRMHAEFVSKLAERRGISLECKIEKNLWVKTLKSLFRELALEISVRVISACRKGDSLRIEVGGMTVDKGGQPGGWARRLVVWKWSVSGERTLPDVSPTKVPKEWPSFLAAALGGELCFQKEPGVIALLSLPRSRTPKRKT